MEIELNLNKEKRELFLEYFHAAYRKLIGGFLSPPGQRRYRKDGRHELTLAFPLMCDSNYVNLTWHMLIEPDGFVKKLEINSDDLPSEIWRAAASKFISEILLAAFSETVTKHFYRDCICCVGADLHGEYWLPGFRFAPSMPEDEHSYLSDMERYFYIDQEISAIDKVHGSDIATERVMRYAARLSLILDAALYQPPGGKRWFITKDESGSLVSKCEHIGFYAPNLPTQMPQKNIECRPGEFGSSVIEGRDPSSMLRCPKETRKILRGLENCAPNIQDAFDSCARLYQTSLVAGKGFPTIRLAYQVGAVESITKKAGDYRGFSDFVMREASLIDEDRKFLDHLYGSIRSAHFHGGEFPLGEYRPRKWSLGVADLAGTDLSDISGTASRLIRKSIMNWVLREVASKAIAQ